MSKNHDHTEERAPTRSAGWRHWWRAALAGRRARSARAELARRCRRGCQAAADIPAQIKQAWLAEAALALPGWQPDETAWVLASGALMQFFDTCRLRTSDTPCALPSRAADSVWHLWLRLDAAGLQAFQQRHFGTVCPHQEGAELGAPMADALAHSWAIASRSEGRSPLGLRLPLMFEADRRLRVPGGWAYGSSALQRQVFHRDIDAWGRARGVAHVHQRIGYAGLVTLGLLSQREVADWEREQARRDTSGGSCGSGGSSGGDGCSCGSSCGSGCGGGCGG